MRLQKIAENENYERRVLDNELWFCCEQIGEYIICIMLHFLYFYSEMNEVKVNFWKGMWYGRFIFIFFERLFWKRRKPGGRKEQHPSKKCIGVSNEGKQNKLYFVNSLSVRMRAINSITKYILYSLLH